MRVAIAQVNPTVGDLRGNRKLVEDAAARAAGRADLVMLPELVLSGYQPMDLLERDGFVRDQLAELDALRETSRRIPIALGAVIPAEPSGPRRLYNAAVLLAGGEIAAIRPKSLLPTYDVFDERRYFRGGERREVVRLPAGGDAFGLTVCEDAWTRELGYPIDPTGELRAAGAGCVLNLSASPWHVGKPAERRRLVGELAARHGVPIALVNQVGGDDELVFDGASFAVDARGRTIAALPLFEPAFEIVELGPGAAPIEADDPEPVAQLEAGLVLGIRDYFRKQGLPPDAVVGLSGGIDSAVTAHLAACALGPERVLGVAMPGPFSSDHSVRDALELGRNLGIEVRRVDITPIYAAYRTVFEELFGAREDYGIAQQNVQARIRGSILMAI